MLTTKTLELLEDIKTWEDAYSVLSIVALGIGEGFELDEIDFSRLMDDLDDEYCQFLSNIRNITIH